MAEGLATWPPTVTWKVENVPKEVGDVAEKSSCHSVKGASWLLAVPSKIGEEITLLLKKNKPGTAGFENPQPSQIPKDAKMKK